MNRDSFLYGLGAITLGLVGLSFADFAMQWQPVAKNLPMRVPLAYASALFLLVAGVFVILPRTARGGVLALAIFYALWTLALHGPRVATHPQDVSIWLGFAEIGALASAGFALYAITLAQVDRARRLLLASRIFFGLCALLFGLSHYIYAAFTATMVPSWLPAPLFWAYATGTGHAAAGLALVSGVCARLAAQCLAGMMGAFVLLLHVPRVIGNAGSQVEWTMLAVALTLTGAAWGLSRALGKK